VRISPEADDLLGRYSWPGNVREMRNVLERLLILHPNAGQIGVDQLPPEIRGGGNPGGLSQDADPTLPLDEVERRHIWAALQHFDGNKSRVAASLRIGRRTLYDKLTKYGLE
jgi:transcriptional regulator with PAS, ATPase and Fis domain